MKQLGIIGNIRKTNTVKICAEILDRIKDKHIKVVLDEEILHSYLEKESAHNNDIDGNKYQGDLLESDLIIVLGGDGTILNVARRLDGKPIPVLAVNTGNLGFMSQITDEELQPILDKLLNDEFTCEKRMMLEVRLIRKGEVIFNSRCLNDAVLSKEAISRMIDLTVSIDGHFTNHYRADGIIVSTPTGSTAHCLSAGGPIVHPHLQAMIMLPICPHTLSNRPIVISATSEIEIIVIKSRSGEGVILTIDGQEPHVLAGDDSVIIKRAEQDFQLITKEGYDYYSTLRTKLKWGGKL